MTDAAWLRSMRTLSGDAPAFDPAQAPADPVVLFRDWLAEAVARGVAELHAMTLATVDPDGLPDSRTLILKDVGDAGWAFAGHRHSAKGVQLGARPAAALSFWWQPLVRAVRVRGSVHEASAEESAADLAARSPAARAGITAGTSRAPPKRSRGHRRADLDVEWPQEARLPNSGFQIPNHEESRIRNLVARGGAGIRPQITQIMRESHFHSSQLYLRNLSKNDPLSFLNRDK